MTTTATVNEQTTAPAQNVPAPTPVTVPPPAPAWRLQHTFERHGLENTLLVRLSGSIRPEGLNSDALTASVRDHATKALESDRDVRRWRETGRQLQSLLHERKLLEARLSAARAEAEKLKLEASPGLGAALVAARQAEEDLAAREKSLTAETAALEGAHKQARVKAVAAAEKALTAARKVGCDEWKAKEDAVLAEVKAVLQQAAPQLSTTRAVLWTLQRSDSGVNGTDLLDGLGHAQAPPAGSKTDG